MKILLATPFRFEPQIGGPAHTVAAIGQKLVESGIDISLFTGDRKRFPPPGKRGSLRDVPSVDLVHNFGMWTPFNHAVSLTSRVVRTPLVLAPLGMLEPWALAQRPERKQLALRLYQKRDLDRAAAVHATAVAEVESVRALGVTAPIALIPHGVEIPADIRHFTAAKQQASGDRVLLFLSRLHPKKGLLDLVEAWRRLRPKGWRVVIAGPDEADHRAQVEASVANSGLTRDFTFTGSVSHAEKERLLGTSDVFVLPTYSENFGLVVPEALGHGTPVLTTQGTPWSELADTRSGWWIETGADALTESLRSVLQLDKNELQAMGQRGRLLAIERYSWPAIISQHVELYRWLTGSAPQPRFIL